MNDPSLLAFSVAIGGVDGTTFAFPHGANVVSPASLFLTVHGTSTGMVAELVHAGMNTLVPGPSPTATVGTARHQVEVRIPTNEWNPGTGVVRLAMGVGLWHQATGAYLLPGVTQSATTPGGGGTAANPAAFFNVAFRTNAQEPMPNPHDPANTATNPAWWRDQAQGAALAAGDITPFHANVDFSKLAAKAADNSGIPVTGPMDRILASHFQTDAAAHYLLNPNWTVITGYSMGGMGTFKLAEEFPDLFAKAQPTVGYSAVNALVPSLRNIPFLMWNMATDELVPEASYGPTALALDSAGYRYELDVYAPGDHLTLAINDQFAPAAAFLGTTTVNRNPSHVTYVIDPALDYPAFGFVANHAYWASGLTARNATTTGTIDVVSHGFGVGDPTPSATQHGAGTLTGGTIPAIPFVSQFKTWGPVPSAATSDSLTITASNVATMTIDVARAHVDCNVALQVTTDGPLTVTLAGCPSSTTKSF